MIAPLTVLLAITIGLTRTGTPIEAAQVLASAPNAPTVLLIGAKPGVPAAYARLPSQRRPFTLVTVNVPAAAPLQFPPQGKAYRDNPESHYLWRWIAMRAPDLVLVAGDDVGHLVDALNSTPFPTLGKIAAKHVSQENPLDGIGSVSASDVRREIERRIARSPAEVARALEPHYGHEFKEAVYIPAMALIARMRMGSLDDVRAIARPFVDGQDSLAKPTASHLAGHLLFAELTENSGDQYWLHLARKAADLGFNPDGSMKESMPFHNEMSDAVFMGCPILAKVGKLTGEKKYFDMTVKHFQFMEKLCHRAGGLWRHSPLDEAAWGRGNAFPALGLALTLGDFPKS
ncbi:MAG: glycoside hydrolase family 88 protein, partial [Bryobacteraceae bacterium]|nr:glycoside hydrolase family 88 protein [Bryobacteraceae bacterium]